MFPIGRPFLLTKLIILALHRFNTVNPRYERVLEDMPQNAPFKLLPGFTKCKSIQDKEFQNFWLN
jgi:hypothetical protein